MAIDMLQEKIRKLKNPSVIMFDGETDQIPNCILEAQPALASAYRHYCVTMLKALQPIVPAVRFHMGGFCLLGDDGIGILRELLQEAKRMGYYVLLDVPECYSLAQAERAAQCFMEEEHWCCDGVILSCYIGEDALQPFVRRLQQSKKDIFVVFRTGNKSAAQLQDLRTGARLMHMAAADIAERLGEAFREQGGYSKVAGVGSAAAPDSLRILREKHPSMFLMAEGYDYSNANAKNCSFAFDRMGHGALVCAGSSVTGAWKVAQTDGSNYLECALEAAERMKKNLLRYVNIL